MSTEVFVVGTGPLPRVVDGLPSSGCCLLPARPPGAGDLSEQYSALQRYRFRSGVRLRAVPAGRPGKIVTQNR